MVQCTPTRGPLRGLRGVGLAATASSLSVAAHAAAGGSVPGPGTTLVAIGLLSAVSTALANRRRGTAFILGALGLSQCVLHYMLQVSAVYTQVTSGVHTAGQLAHVAHHGGMPFNATVMSLGHAVAAVLTGLMLAGAEDALFFLARLVGWVLPRKPSSLPVTTSLGSVVFCWAPIRRLAELIPQRIQPLRGPPQVS